MTPLTNHTSPTRQFEFTIYYNASDQLTSVINKPLVGSSVETFGNYFAYDKAGNIGSKQVKASAHGLNMSATVVLGAMAARRFEMPFRRES